MTKILGLDYGQQRIGVAVSDDLQITAQGKPTIQRKNLLQVFLEIQNIIEYEGISLIVIGLPLNMNGSNSSMSLEVERFSQQLALKTKLPVELWDERLTSKQAERILIDGQTSRAKRKQKIDKIAAVILLQSYLDSQNC